MGQRSACANAQAVANAMQLKAVVGEPITGDLNPEMLKRYPELEAIAQRHVDGAVAVKRTRQWVRMR